MIKVVKKHIDNKENVISDYMSAIGRKGGKKSRRKLGSDVARKMIKLREARRAFKKYYSQCFWSFDPNYVIQFNDINWVAEQLKKNGNRQLWLLGCKLCR